jgi:membrane associated rhomboid family serine protease
MFWLRPWVHMLMREQFDRLWRSALLAAAGIAAALYVLDPSAIETSASMEVRRWSPAVVTCLAMTAVNVAVCILWRHPRMGWYFNRYMMLSAGAPRAFSVLGCAWSHSQWPHLWGNTAALFAFGLPREWFRARLSLVTVLTMAASARGGRAGELPRAVHDLRAGLVHHDAGVPRPAEKSAVRQRRRQRRHFWHHGRLLHAEDRVSRQDEALGIADRRSRSFQLPYFGQVDYNTWYFMAALLAYETFDVLFGPGTNSNMCHLSGLGIGTFLGLTLRRQMEAKEGQDKESHDKESQDTKT